MEKNSHYKKNPLSKHYQEFMLARTWLEDGDDLFIDQAKNLLQKGWDLNEQNEHGDTILHIAVRNNKWQCLEWLISVGGNCLVPNKHGHTPVWLARRKNGKFFPDSFKNIYDKAKENGLLEEKSTPITSIDSPHLSNVSNIPKPKKEEVKHSESNNLINAWTVALKNKDYKATKQMLFAGMELDKCNDQGRTPLHEAIHNNEWEVVEYLINYGAKFLTKDLNGKSCLDYVEDKWNVQDPELDIYSYEMVQFALKDEKKLETQPLASISNENPIKSKEQPKKTYQNNNNNNNTNYDNDKKKRIVNDNKSRHKVNFVMDQNVKKDACVAKEEVPATMDKSPIVVIKKSRKLMFK